MKLTALNVRRIVLNLRANGRKVDMTLTLRWWRKFYKEQDFSNWRTLTEICDMFRADLWNISAVN